MYYISVERLKDVLNFKEDYVLLFIKTISHKNKLLKIIEV